MINRNNLHIDNDDLSKVLQNKRQVMSFYCGYVL